MNIKRHEIENEIIRGLIHLTNKGELFEILDEHIFAYNKEVFNALSNLYNKEKAFVDADAKYILSNLKCDLDLIESFMKKDGISSLKVKECIIELKKIYALNMLNYLAKDIVKDIEKNMNPEEIIFDIKNSIDKCTCGSFNRIYYKKKGNKVSVDKAELAEWIKDKYKLIKKDKHMYIYNNGVYKVIDHEAIKEFIFDNLNGEFKSDNCLINNTTDLVKIIKNKEALRELDLSKNINFKNCILDLKEKKVREHSENLLSTVQVNSKYNSNAKCPYFLEWIKGRVGQEDILTIQEMLGYMMTGSVQAKVFFMLHGKGDTGKSTLINIVQEIIGKQNISALTLQQLGEKFAVAELYNRIVNIYADLPSEAMKESSKLKELVSGDLVTGEKKNKDPFTFNNMAKFLFSCNTLPPTSDRTDAFFNRCIIISMDNKIEVKDPDCLKKLLAEKEGIVAWAVEGLYRLLDNKYKFTISKQSQLNINKYKEENDSLGLFIKEKCIKTEGAFTLITAFKNEYIKYCKTLNLKSISANTVNAALKEKGFTIKKVNNKYTIIGLGLITS